MFHIRLLELESELLAKEESARGLKDFTPECGLLLDQIENEIGPRLADKAPKDWRGWISYRRGKESLIICRGRSFGTGGLFAQCRAGLDVTNGADTIADYQRGFDVTPPQDLDHLLLNFGSGKKTRIFLWYGENIAPYRLIFEADVDGDPQRALHDAVVEACTWVVKRPKHVTLPEFLKGQEKHES